MSLTATEMQEMITREVLHLNQERIEPYLQDRTNSRQPFRRISIDEVSPWRSWSDIEFQQWFGNHQKLQKEDTPPLTALVDQLVTDVKITNHSGEVVITTNSGLVVKFKISIDNY